MGLSALLLDVARAAGDLVFGSCCAGCAEHSGLLCPSCRESLMGPVTAIDCVPGRPEYGLAVTARYAGPVRSAIIDHKEHGRLPLARPLGDALAVAVTALWASASACGHVDRGVVLIPVPSTRQVVRRRGHDPMLRIARRAAATLRRVGQPTIVVSALRHARSVADQAGLDRQARERNQRESMIACRSISHAVAGRCIILADDIVTTGATLREGVRALGRAGVEPCGAVVVAAAT